MLKARFHRWHQRHQVSQRSSPSSGPKDEPRMRLTGILSAAGAIAMLKVSWTSMVSLAGKLFWGRI